MVGDFATNVTTGEITTLKHELRNHTVELAARVTEALLAGAELAEVLDGLGDNVVEKLEVDTARAGCFTTFSLMVLTRLVR